MVKPKGFRQESISNLSLDLIDTAFLLLCEHALPAYKQHINSSRPPVDGRENATSAAAIVMLLSGLDYHLCWLKYSKETIKLKISPPHAPIFSWSFDDYLVVKVRGLLTRRTERGLLAQIIEITACRDSIIHPKIYTITHVFDADFNIKHMKGCLVPGAKLRNKTKSVKMKRKDATKLLKIPLVPTWIGYADAVLSVFVVYRLFLTLEIRYGKSYMPSAVLSRYARKAKHLFGDLEWPKDYRGTLQEWISAFYKSLSIRDQEKVAKVLGGEFIPILGSNNR